MPGLTLNTNTDATSAGVAAGAIAPSQTPGALAATAAGANPTSSRGSSPERPTYSPITPPLKPTIPASSSTAATAVAQQQQQPLFPPRQTYTHGSQVPQTAQSAVMAPPPEPIDFDTNPDVIALRSAITILQMQRNRAGADIAALERAKNAALAEPEAFLQDLGTGRIGVDGDRLFVGGVRTDKMEVDDSDDSDDEEEKEEGVAGESNNGNKVQEGTALEGERSAPHPNGTGAPSATSTEAPPPPPSSEPQATAPEAVNIKTEPDAMEIDPATITTAPVTATPAGAAATSTSQVAKPWTTLPKPQNVVRVPPVNWAQYAVVGDSFDRLHNEQLSRPTLGAPATLTADGRYEFKGASSDRPGEPLIGIAAPYTPGRDRIDRKGKGPKR